MSAIAATFSDFRPVKSRGVYQIILEVPAEGANAVLIALGGLPVFGKEQWVGVAPLAPYTEDHSPPSSTGSEQPHPMRTVGGSNPSADTKPRTPFHDLPRAQQAALLLNNPQFRRWLRSDGTVEDADRKLKACLEIESKREINNSGWAASWAEFVATYLRETGQVAEIRG